VHHDGRLLATRAAAHLLLHIRAVLDVLVEVADVAADFLVRLEREGDQRHEAESEPFPGRKKDGLVWAGGRRADGQSGRSVVGWGVCK
jgi:hypothetical protein